MAGLAEYDGYKWGERIEYKYSSLMYGTQWHPGVITDFDQGDDQPFYVVSNGDPGDGWVSAANVRKVKQDAAPVEARQLQYKLDKTSGPTTQRNAGTWQNIEVGASSLTAVSISISPSAHYQRIQFRQMIPHTDDEILAELRKLDRFGLSPKARDILDGKF